MKESNCKKLAASFENIRALYQTFSTQYSAAREVEGLRGAKLDADKIKKFVVELREILTWDVQDAVNPYHQVFLENEITDPKLNPTKKKIKLDWKREVWKTQDLYKERLLGDWAANLEGVEEKFKKMSLEKRRIIQREIRDGAIAILMPGANTQFNTTMPTIKAGFNPLWIEDGSIQTVSSVMVWGDFEKLVELGHPGLVAGVPDKPYVLLVKPTPAPLKRTCDKTVEEQKRELIKMNEERAEKNLAPVDSIGLFEYLALQQQFSRRAKEEFNSVMSRPTLTPLDDGMNTILISMPTIDNYYPAFAWFAKLKRLVIARWRADGKGDIGGFRTVVRVEI
jgi:hypothetical protein